MFTSKPGGHNALYCSKRCRGKARWERKPGTYRKRLRIEDYERIKNNVARYDKHLLNNRKSRSKVRVWLANYKMERGCKDCGFKGHYAALQLDHEGPKTRPIADCRSSVTALMEEIERGKCVVRCANCHSIRTWQQKQEGRK